MNARDEALRHYGGDPPRCAWCGTEQGPFEIDHIDGGQGQGNAHRQTIKGKLEYWLKRQGWPAGYQVLCRHCHDLKSGRTTHMPPRKGTEDMHINLPTDLIERLTVLASAPGMTRSKVMEQALTQLLEQGASETLLAGLHQRFDSVIQAMGEMKTTVEALDVKVTGLDARVKTQAEKYQSFVDAVNSLYDHEKAGRNGQAKRSWFGR